MTTPAPRWMTLWLRAAAIYNIAWGAGVVLFPLAAFEFAGLEPPRYPSIWQCVGMIVGVYGVGYWIASRDPFRHWPIVLVGLLGKIFGPIGFAWTATRGELPWSFGWTILANDLLWWPAFAGILYGAFRAASAPPEDAPRLSEAEALAEFRTDKGESIAELSRRAPALLVFLRHTGCTFCKEALADIASRRAELARGGAEVVVVSMSTHSAMQPVLEQNGLADLAHVSDPDRVLYRALGLRRGTLRQLFGWKVFRRGAEAFLKGGHGVGKLAGDGFQLPGVFLVEAGRVSRAFRHETAADRPDYAALACPAPSPEPGRSPAASFA